MDEESTILEFLITEEYLAKYKRLDAFLADVTTDLSRSLIKKLFLDGHVSCSDETVKLELKRMPPLGTTVIFELPPAEETDIQAENIPLEILFEDEHLIVINKPVGLVVHPAPGNPNGTLVNAIVYHCPDLKGIGNEKRPGIVHRLDKGTSGVMVVAKSQAAHEGLVKLFSAHNIERRYEAIILGTKIPSHQTITSTIGRSPYNRLKMAARVKIGKEAITHLKVLKYYKHFSHVECQLETGRTHQIRVHLSDIVNTPIINDSLYGRLREEQLNHTSKMRSLLKDYEHPLLHAKVLGFRHPITGADLYFEKEPPVFFQQIIQALEEEDV
jgi:23S rRNA pseudouridine1911/1915/1917 synthase